MSIEYHPAVERELREAREYYERRAPGLGREFARAQNHSPRTQHLQFAFPQGVLVTMLAATLAVAACTTTPLQETEFNSDLAAQAMRDRAFEASQREEARFSSELATLAANRRGNTALEQDTEGAATPAKRTGAPTYAPVRPPETIPQPDIQRPPKHAKRVGVLMYDPTPRPKTARLDVYDVSPPERAYKIVALLTCEGTVKEEVPMMEAIFYRARQIGADAVMSAATVVTREGGLLVFGSGGGFGTGGGTRCVYRARAIVYIGHRLHKEVGSSSSPAEGSRE